jgi:hypothetical protein
MTIPKAIAYSPHTTLSSGCDTTAATEMEVTSLAAFPDLDAGEIGIVVLCAEEDFRSTDAADFETLTYNAKNAGTSELEGLVHVEGTARSWPSGTSVASYGTAYGWEEVRSAIDDSETHIANTTTAHGAVSAATASKIMVRDGDGRARVALPSHADDIVPKGYIDNKLYDNAGAHNSIYRGKYLGDEYTSAQSAVIAAGTFDDLYIGDYWTIDEVNYRIAAFNYFYNVGDDPALTTHHAVIVPDTPFGNATMEATDITTNGYRGSLMRSTNIATAKTACKAAFTIGASVKVLNHRQLLCNASSGGLASGWAWTDCEVELMNEVMVYGSIAWGSGGGQSGYNVATSHGVLPLFALRPDLVNIRVTYWLRDVVSATDFAGVGGYGVASSYYASGSGGVRPAFSIS